MTLKRTLTRYSKYYLYKYQVYRLIPGWSLKFIGHMAGVSKWIKNHRNLPFSDFPTRKFNYDKRFELYQYVIDNEIKGSPVEYLEFGVSTGGSFRWWLEHETNPDSYFHGFDTFSGLPEDWGQFKKGDMSNGNEPPVIDDNRHKFYQGLFQQTLYDFLDNFKSDKKKVIHLDADLYSATLFVLTLISPFLKKGDILLFDEFNVPMHEYKAFQEWVDSFYVEYTPIGEVNNYLQVAIRIDKDLR